MYMRDAKLGNVAMNRLGTLAALLAALLLANCATVTRGTTNQIQITSEPSEAEAKTSLGQACRTPCTLTVNRKDEFTVVVSKPGYKEATVEVKTQVAGAGVAGVAGNILIGGVIGAGVDVATGAALEHKPNPVEVVLEPDRKGPPDRRRGKEKPKPVARPAPPPPAEAPEEKPPVS